MIKIKGFITIIGSGISYLVGGWTLALEVLIVLMSIDYLTGVLRGAINKELSSRRGAIGIAKKSLIFVVLIVASMGDKAFNSGDVFFRDIVCWYYIANESISILENCAAMDLDIPDFIKDRLIQIKELMNKGEK